MSIKAVAHLNFHGQAREALTFYESVFSGQATIMTYGDVGMPPELRGAGKVVFGQVVADNGFSVMAYDVPGDGPHAGTGAAAMAPHTRRGNGMTLTSQPFCVVVRGETVEEVAALWDGLSVGADIVEAYGPSQWAPASGMLTDRFGVTWVLDVKASAPNA